VSTDGAINGGTNPRIGAVAYTNSVAGATTMLYDIDFAQINYTTKPTKRWRFTSGRRFRIEF
jgi:hypothetical protein